MRWGLQQLIGTATRLATQPPAVASAEATLAAELAKVVSGRLEVAPTPHDWRFADPSWIQVNAEQADLPDCRWPCSPA